MHAVERRRRRRGYVVRDGGDIELIVRIDRLRQLTLRISTSRLPSELNGVVETSAGGEREIVARHRKIAAVAVVVGAYSDSRLKAAHSYSHAIRSAHLPIPYFL